MLNSVKINNLSFYNDNGILTISAKQYDTGRKFIFNIVDNDEAFDVSDCSVYLRMLKADGKQFQGEECCSVDGNKIIVDTAIGNGNQILTSEGLNNCELHLTDSEGNSLTTWDFIIDVEPRVHNGDRIDSIDSWDGLDNITEVVLGFQASLDEHFNDKENPHGVTKKQVGLGNVPNVATNDQTPTYTKSSTLTALVSGEKLSVAFGKISKAINDLISHIANKENPHEVTKKQVGLENVDNTSDEDKPISKAQQTALDKKVDSVKIGTTEYKSGTTVTLPVYTKDEVDTAFGADIALTIDTSTYKMTLSLKDKKGNTLTSKEIDFPIESMVIDASYTKDGLVLKLQNGTTLEPIDISAIISGLVPDTRKIAGLDLKDDITVTELRESLNIPDEISTSADVETTTERTLLKSHAGGLKVNRVDGESVQKQYSGKNVCPTNNITETAESGNNFKHASIAMNLKPSTVYTFSADVKVNTGNVDKITVGLINSSLSTFGVVQVCTIFSNRISFSFTSGEDLTNYKYLIMYAGVQGSTAGKSVTFSNIQLEEGSTATDYEPYVGGTASPNPSYPQEIKSVEISGIKASGKNLLKPPTKSNTVGGVTFTLNEDKSVTVKGTATQELYSGITYSFKPTIGKSYRISGGSYTSSSLQAYFAGFNGKNDWVAHEFIFTAETDNTINFSVYVKKGTTVNGNTFYPMIRPVEIEDATYEPYRGEKSIQLSSPITLRGIGDVKDMLCKQDGVYGVVSAYPEMILDGDETITAYGKNETYYGYLITPTEGTPLANGLPMSDHFSEITASEQYFGSKIGICPNYGNYIGISTDKATVAEFKAWLAENNTKICYPVATPTFEPLPLADQIALHQLETFDTVTYISTDSEIEPVMEVEYGTSKVGAYAIKGMNDAEVEKLLGDEVIPIERGGTGATTAKEAQYNLLNDMNEVTGDMSDDTQITGAYASPSTTTGRLFYIKLSKIWDYTKSKISSVLGLSETGLASGKSIGGIKTISTSTASNSTGNPTYLLMFDVTTWYNSTTVNQSKIGFTGLVYSTRDGGNMHDEVAEVRMGVSYSKATSENGATLLLRSSSSAYQPCIVHDITNDKYYLSLRITGFGGRPIKFQGVFSGTYVGTKINTTNSSGALPDGYEIAISDYKTITHARATADANGNNIASTYATQTEVIKKWDSTVSRTANTILAAPDGKDGAGSFRKLVANDLPTVPASKGGTGKTTLVDSANALMNALTTGDADPKETDYYIAQYSGGGTTTTTYHRRPISALYNTFKAKMDSVYLKLSGGTLTGDVSLPITKSSKDASLPVAGATMSIDDIKKLSDYKTYLGSYTDANNVWYNIISIRHRNGSGDGMNYGMYLRSALTSSSNLVWGKQVNASSWQSERTILDSSNYKTYCTPDNIGALSTTGTATAASKLTLAEGTDDAYRNVWFSVPDEDGRAATDADFKYNPYTNTLKSKNYTVNDKVNLSYNSTTNSLDFDFL